MVRVKIERNLCRTQLGKPGLDIKHLLLCAVAWLALPCLAMASEYHGQVTFGGLPVPGTSVTVTATQGGKTAVAITDTQGVFDFPDLADGTWDLDIEMTGFAPVKQQVTVAPNAPAAKFELKLLSLAEIRAQARTVVEAAPVAAANTESAAQSSAAPAAGNAASPKGNAAAAKTKTAGAQQAGSAASSAASAAAPAEAPAQDATAAQANDGFLINGSVNNAATSQFSLSPAFGNTRAGGRSLFNYGLMLHLDNSALDAKPFSVTGLDTPRPSYNNITAGANFGGPLLIPHLLPAARAPYFYLFYQRTQNNSDTTQQALMPTLAERGGNLSQAPNVTAVYAPASGLSPACLASPGVTPGQPFPGNVVPTACLSNVAQNLLGFYPLPTPGIPAVSQYNFQVPLVSSSHQDVFQAYLQKSIGNKDYLSGRFNLQSTRSSAPSLFGFSDNTGAQGINANVGWYHRFTQRISSNVGYSFSRASTLLTPYFANRENVSQEVGIAGNDQADPNYWAPPTLGFASGIAGFSDGTASSIRNETNQLTFSVNWNKLRHNVVIGGDFSRREFNYLTESNPQGQLNFTGAATQSSSGAGGSDIADFLLGIPDTSAIAYGNADKYLRETLYDLYANDDFRVNPEFTVNAGIRYEYGSPVSELKGRLVNLDVTPGFTNEAPVLGSDPVGPLTGQIYPSSLVRPDRSEIAPIVGIAWRPVAGSSLLIRSGYGVYYDTSVYQATAYAMAQQAPLSTSLSIASSASCGNIDIANPFIAQTGANCVTTTPDTFAIDPNFRVGYAQEWKLSVQRDLPGSLQMVVTYLGIKGTRGVQQFLPNTYPVGAANPCPSCPSGYQYRTSNGNSTREAGSVELRRRLRSGFTADLTYTYAKAIDDDYALGGQGPVTAGSIGGSGGGSGQVAQDWLDLNAQRGLSTFDQRNVLSTTLQYTTGMGLGGKTLLSGWRGVAYKEWTILASINAASGMPLTPFDPVAMPGAGASCAIDCIRADYLGGAVHLHQPGLFLNPAAYAAPAPGQWGNAARDSITGPGQFSLNGSMDRTFRVHNRYTMEARIDAANVLNHVTYPSWNTSVGTPLFGTVTGANAMRSMSATMRVRF